MVNLHFNPSFDDVQRREAIFRGDLILYGLSSASSELCGFARELTERHFQEYSQDPQRAQFEMPVEQFVAVAGPLKSEFTNHLHTKELVRQFLVASGCDPERTFFDVPRLRVVTHENYLSAGVGYAYKAHRDIWYSSPTSQLNWWMPVYALAPERSLALYPGYWDKPIRNSSATFNYGEWTRVGREQARSQIKSDTRNHPLPQEPVQSDSELRIVCDAGATVVFSSAHLHATAPNMSGVTRFSLDFRTVSLDDLQSGAGAPNIDNAATGTTLADFLRVSDFSRIPDDLVPA